MNTMKQKPSLPLVLILEDDPDIAGAWKKLAEENGWAAQIAGSVESAVLFARKNHSNIKLVMVDVMVPMTEEDLAHSNRVQEERKSLQVQVRKQHAKTSPDTVELRLLDAELAALDSVWRQLIVMDGGFLFLEEARGEGWIGKWRFAICSARDKAEGLKELEDRLIITSGERWLGWFSKPTRVEEMQQLLAAQFRDLTQKTRRKNGKSA